MLSLSKQLRAVEENRRDNEEEETLYDKNVWAILKWLEERFHQIFREIKVKTAGQIEARVTVSVCRYEPTHQLMYCENLKISSSTWATHFLSLNNVQSDPATPVHGLNRKVCPPLYGEERELFLSTGLSFIVVRDPFERLLSAYLVKATFQASRKYLISILGQTLYRIYNRIKRMDYLRRCSAIYKR